MAPRTRSCLSPLSAYFSGKNGPTLGAQTLPAREPGHPGASQWFVQLTPPLTPVRHDAFSIFVTPLLEPVGRRFVLGRESGMAERGR